jgi:hypothetical protein
MQKKLMIASGLALGALAVVGTGVMYAQATTTGKSLVDEIAQRFGLKKADVQQVFDQHKTETMQNRQQMMSDKLELLVKDGKLTEDQKVKLQAKLEERKNNMQDFKNLTKDQIKAKMDQEKADFDNWAKENNIDVNALGLNFGMGMRGRGMEKGGHWDQDENNPQGQTQTQ